MGLGFKQLAALLSIKKAKFEQIQCPLFLMLCTKWWNNLLWPTPLSNTSYPYIGLLVDSTTTEICWPGGPFEEVKPYYDAKNQIYSLKKEVAVSAAAPLLFSFPSGVRT